eukprot:TRINITY_DN10450_c0_g1_i3.p1 TRINITY_DN10450_c0_g1~~TRINITY_DN10450_c0_g1_i3.p1  ORF type:complete len:153 (+),score=20.00 TRINITY_DN10450_c0_g1_i3:587-1045(+)
MGTDGDIMIGYSFRMKTLEEAYKNRNQGDARSLDSLQDSYDQHDEDVGVEKWVETCLTAHYTQKDGTRMKYSFQANPLAKVLQCQRWLDHQHTENFGIGFYVSTFRCSDGENTAAFGLREFLLSDAEKERLDAATGALGLETDGLLQVFVRS